MDKKFRVPLKESYLLIIIIVGILSLCMYSSFALFSLEKTTSKDIFTMRAASDIETTLKIFEYKKITVSAGDNTSVMVNVNNDTGGSIYYGVFYGMVSPSTKTDDIGIYKIDWSANATSGSITNGSKLPVEIIIINNSSSDITLNIGVAGSDSNELGLPDGKALITETFNTGTEPSGDAGEAKTTTTDYSYTGAVQTATLKAGTHKLEVWGAQGGAYNSYVGGNGGYSKGTLTLTEDTTAYVYVGGYPGTAKTAGFNGGSGTGNYGGGGGGASDIRIVTDSLYARVIVAGGGGGAGYSSATGGAGGGTSGVTGSGTGTYAHGGGGTQTSGGTSANTSGTGTFGTGGGSTSINGGGGGGGWYGGGHGQGGSKDSAGGGGSGYVYTSSTAASYPSGVKLNSSYYLTNASTVAGNTSFTDNSGSTVTGHSGNGYARITSTVKASTAPSIDTSSVTLKPDPVTNLKDIVTCKDNGSGCKIVLVKPSNTSKMEERVTKKVLYVLEDNNGKRYKYNKNVVLSTNAVELITKLNDNTSGDSRSGVYKVTHSAIPAESSATGSEIPAVTDYRYYGANPNNYICLDMEGGSTCPDRGLYRIIGSIYEENAGENLIKVIKATPLTNGSITTYAWDSNYNIWATPTNGNYSNSLSNGASLMKLLNSGDWWNRTNTYANYGLTATVKSMINTSRYYLGGIGGSKIVTGDAYGYERGTNRYDTGRPLYWDGYVGLMYPSDYGYAAGNICVTSTKLNNYEGCKNKDWLYISNTGQWLMSPDSDFSENVFYVYGGGTVFKAICYNVLSVRPTFYLKADTNIKSGDGSSTNPYILS